MKSETKLHFITTGDMDYFQKFLQLHTKRAKQNGSLYHMGT